MEAVEVLSGWVKQIMQVVIFAGIIELILPDSGIRRFVRVVIGLFIMLAVLQPIIDFLQSDHLTVMASIGRYRSAEGRLSAGIPKDASHTVARELYVKAVNEQIRTLLEADAAVKLVSIDTVLDEEAARGAGSIKSMVVRVRIAADGQQAAAQAARITQRIAEVYQLERRSILVSIES